MTPLSAEQFTEKVFKELIRDFSPTSPPTAEDVKDFVSEEYGGVATITSEAAQRMADKIGQHYRDNPTLAKQVFPINRESVPFIPIRKENWIESESNPGIFTNDSGEVMHGPSRKVRAVEVGFNPKTRKWRKRVWLDESRGYEYHDQLLIERYQIKQRLKRDRK